MAKLYIARGDKLKKYNSINIYIFFVGIHRQALRLHAEADRLRHLGRGHDHGLAAQQPQAVGEAHQGRRDRDLRPARPEKHEKLGLEISRLSLRLVHL